MLRCTRTVAGLLVILATLAWPARATNAQSTWDRYKPGTLSSVMRENEATIREAISQVPNPDKRPSEHFVGDQPTLATVIFKGGARPIDSIRSRLISAWGLTHMRDSSIAADFHREYLFQEGDKLLWLPVQDRVASFFAKELRPGQQVKLYVMLLAGYYDKDRITWAFIVNEFRAGPVAGTF
jgi:hypothetical protein